MEPFSLPAPLKSRERLDEEHALLTLEHGFAAEPRPGQFAMLKSPLRALARPFSYFDADGGTATFLVKARGGVTRALVAGDVDGLRLSRPLGKPFPPLDGTALVGGGTGFAPLHFALARGVARAPTALWGLRTATPALRALVPTGVELVVESAGDGTVVERFARVSPRCDVLACGPSAMLRALAPLVRGRYLVSLEGVMACGTGLCMGCAAPLVRGGYARVCTDGPWFDASRVVL